MSQNQGHRDFFLEEIVIIITGTEEVIKAIIKGIQISIWILLISGWGALHLESNQRFSDTCMIIPFAAVIQLH